MHGNVSVGGSLLWMGRHLSVVSDHFAVGRSHSVAIVLHLVVPGLDGVAPAALVADPVDVLTAAAGCTREREEDNVFLK